MGNFETAQADALPPWLHDAQGEAFARTFGGIKDDELAVLKGAVQLPWPSVGPDDALALQGRDRGMPRAPGESLDRYRLRLQDPFGHWQAAPTKAGIAAIFAPYGWSAATAVVLNNYEGTTDGNLAAWSRFLVVLGDSGGLIIADTIWSDPGAWDDGGLWDLNGIGVVDLDWMRQEVRNRKAPDAYPVALLAVPFGSDGVWASPGTWEDGGFWNAPGTKVVPLLLGHTWNEHAWLGGGPGLWDEPGDVWDAFVAPSTGWIL